MLLQLDVSFVFAFFCCANTDNADNYSSKMGFFCVCVSSLNACRACNLCLCECTFVSNLTVIVADTYFSTFHAQRVYDIPKLFDLWEEEQSSQQRGFVFPDII